jgi:hypothetical protein
MLFCFDNELTDHVSTLSSPTEPLQGDTDELKTLLGRRKERIYSDEIVQIEALFYAGKSGGSVSFDSFIQAIGCPSRA